MIEAQLDKSGKWLMLKVPFDGTFPLAASGKSETAVSEIERKVMVAGCSKPLTIGVNAYHEIGKANWSADVRTAEALKAVERAEAALQRAKREAAGPSFPV